MIFANWHFVGIFPPPVQKTGTDSDNDTESLKNPKAERDITASFGLFTVRLVAMTFFGFSLTASAIVCILLLLIGCDRFYLGVLNVEHIPSLPWFIFAYLPTVALPKGPWGFKVDIFNNRIM